jgi:hypothetical protein
MSNATSYLTAAFNSNDLLCLCNMFMVSMVRSGSTVCMTFGIRSRVPVQPPLGTGRNGRKKVENGATTFSMTTFSIMDLFVTFSVKDTQHNESLYKH